MKAVVLPIAAACLLVLFTLVPTWSFGQSAGEIRAEMAAHNAEIAKLEAEIAVFEKELTAIGAQKQTLESTIAALDVSRRQLNARMDLTRRNISTIELELRQLDRDIAITESSMEESVDGLKEALVRLYELDNQTFVEAVLGSASLSQVWDTMETNRVVQDALRSHIVRLMGAREALADNRAASEAKHAELTVQRQTLASQQHSLDISRREQANLLSQTRSTEANYQALLEEKRVAKAQFQRALDELESKLEYTLDPTRVPAAGRGILRWPLDNVFITQQFGRTSSSGRLYASGTHNGIDLRASIGTPVKAALSGIVAGTGNTDGGGCYSYGKWVLIKHGNGLSTLYAHLSDVRVSLGEQVGTGKIIGYSGFTGYATGPHLHFTVFASDAVQVRDLGAWYRENGMAATTACARQGVTIPVSAQSGYLNPLDYL